MLFEREREREKEREREQMFRWNRGRKFLSVIFFKV